MTKITVVHFAPGALHKTLELMGDCWEPFQLGGMPNTYAGYVTDLCNMIGVEQTLRRDFGVQTIYRRRRSRARR